MYGCIYTDFSVMLCSGNLPYLIKCSIVLIFYLQQNAVVSI